VILSLVGDRLPEQVRCMGEAFLNHGVADVTLTAMRFAGGIDAHVYVSWINPFKEQKLTVIGSKAMVVFDDTKPWDQKLRLFKQPLQWNGGEVPVASKSEGEAVAVPQSEPLRDECAHFLECCETRSTPRTDAEEGLRVLRVLQAAQFSLEAWGDVHKTS
jgi:UDP-2-acetamido-3-amino-2,3-dideoxy-glucuronate N-acetyltransferase